MPSTLKLKRPSLARLLASLRAAPSRKSSFPVRTGFPTSLVDLVVKNHGRLRKPRKPRRQDALVPPPSMATEALTVEVANEVSPPPSPVRLSPVALRRPEASPRTPRSAAVFRLRPWLLAPGGAVALAVLAVWTEGTVAAFTVAALSLLWIESASSRRRRPEEAEALPDSCVSPIREVEEAPRSSCSDSDRGSEAPSPRTGERRELFAGGSGGEDPASPKQKAKRSLKKLFSKKLQKKPKSKDSSCSLDEQPDAGGGEAEPVPKTESLVTASESSAEWSSFSSSSSSELAVAVVDGRGPGIKFPVAALAPVILAGLAVGKLPATALAVLCIVFSSAVQRL